MGQLSSQQAAYNPLESEWFYFLSLYQQKGRDSSRSPTHWSLTGHTLVTHTWLTTSKGEEPSCDESLPTENILLFCCGHSYVTHHILWWVSSHRKYFAVLLFCSDLTEAKERHITARSFRVLFRGASFDCIFEYLKDINSFGTLQFCVTFWSSFFFSFFFRFIYFLPLFFK